MPELMLNKKHNSINYHVVREAVASGILRVGKKDTLTNLKDPLTKLVPYSRKQELLEEILWDYWMGGACPTSMALVENSPQGPFE